MMSKKRKRNMKWIFVRFVQPTSPNATHYERNRNVQRNVNMRAWLLLLWSYHCIHLTLLTLVFSLISRPYLYK